MVAGARRNLGHARGLLRHPATRQTYELLHALLQRPGSAIGAVGHQGPRCSRLLPWVGVPTRYPLASAVAVRDPAEVVTSLCGVMVHSGNGCRPRQKLGGVTLGGDQCGSAGDLPECG